METNPFAPKSAPEAEDTSTEKGTVPAPQTDLNPASETDSKAKSKASTLTGWGTRRRKLTDDEVEELRKTYRFRRDLAEAAETPEDWETVNETLEDMAAQSNGLVTASALNRLVLGESYVNAPGPLDTTRVARRAHNRQLATRLGSDVARSMARAGRNVVAPSHVVIKVTRPGGKTKEFTYPAGTTVTVESVAGDMPDKPAKPATSDKK